MCERWGEGEDGAASSERRRPAPRHRGSRAVAGQGGLWPGHTHTHVCSSKRALAVSSREGVGVGADRRMEVAGGVGDSAGGTNLLHRTREAARSLLWAGGRVDEHTGGLLWQGARGGERTGEGAAEAEAEAEAGGTAGSRHEA